MKQQIIKCPQCRRIIHVSPAEENTVLWRLCHSCRKVEHDTKDLAVRCLWVTLALGSLIWWMLR